MILFLSSGPEAVLPSADGYLNKADGEFNIPQRLALFFRCHYPVIRTAYFAVTALHETLLCYLNTTAVA